VFGVKAAVRYYQAPQGVPPGPSAAAAPQTATAVAAVPTSPPVSAPVPAAPLPSAAPLASGAEWVPSSLKKVAESGRIADEIHGVVSGDVDPEGNGEVIAYGRKGIHLYRVNGSEILPKARITDGIPGHILNVEAVDLDGDGEKEIVVTGIEGESLRSTVLKKKGDTFGRIADRLPYYLVLLPDWQGKKVLAGQQKGDDFPFHGKLYAMVWDGKTLRLGEALPADTLRAPLSSGILGLTSARFGEEWKWIYTDNDDHLRVLAAGGVPEYKTDADYGWSGDSFEWGLYLPRQGRTRFYVRKAARVSPGPNGRPLILIPKADQGLLSMEFSSKTTRLVLLRWDGGEFVETAGTPKGDRIYSGAGFFSRSGHGRGAKIVASAIEQAGGVIKGGISRLLLFIVE